MIGQRMEVGLIVRHLGRTAKHLRTVPCPVLLDVFRDGFSYNAREAEGTQSPGETLRSKSGTCRDFEVLRGFLHASFDDPPKSSMLEFGHAEFQIA